MKSRSVESLESARYDLTDEEAVALTELLFERHAAFLLIERPVHEATLCIAVDGRDPLANLGRRLEQTVFDEEAGDHSVSVMHDEYGPYEDHSLFFLGVDLLRREVTGCVRIVAGAVGIGPPVKTIRDLLERPELEKTPLIDLRDRPNHIFHTSALVGTVGRHRTTVSTAIDRTYIERFHAMNPGDVIFDMATAVIPRSIRTGESLTLSLLLYSAAFRAARSLNAKHGVTIVRSDLLEVWRGLLGMEWEALAGQQPFEYVSGDPFLSQPSYISFRQLDAQVNKALLEDTIGIAPLDDSPRGRFVRLMGDPRLDSLVLQRS